MPARALLASLLIGASVSTSCTTSVTLGSECPAGVESCAAVEPVEDGSGLRPMDPGFGVPANVMDGGSVDVEAEPALHDAGLASSPVALLNPSFERQGGVGGDVVLSNTVSALVPVAPVDTVFAQLPNWYACVPLSVSSLSWRTVAGEATQLSDHGDYLSFVINGTTVRQELGAPLSVGTSYSYTAQVATFGEGTQSLRLEVQGATSACGAGTRLGRSAVLKQSERWNQTCVTFTADKPYAFLLLAPSYEGEAPPGSARMHLDELRQVPSCPMAVP